MLADPKFVQELKEKPLLREERNERQRSLITEINSQNLVKITCVEALGGVQSWRTLRSGP